MFFFVSFIASALGVIVGVLTIGKFFLNMQMTYYVIPEYSVYIIPEVYILAGLTVVIITLITYLSCRKKIEKLENNYGYDTSKTYGIEFMDGDTKKANTLTINDSKDKLRYTGHEKML